MERPHAVGLGTGLPRALPAGSACSAWGPAGCWHPGEPRAAPRRGAPRCHPAPRRVLRSLQEATGQGGREGTQPPGAVLRPTRHPNARRAPRARSPAPGRGIWEGQGRSQHGGGQQQERASALLRRLREIPGHAAPCPAPPTSACPRLGAPGSDPPPPGSDSTIAGSHTCGHTAAPTPSPAMLWV